MSTVEEVVDATVVDAPPQADRYLPVPRAALAVTPQVKATELVERLAVIREAMNDAMKADVDYGVIPGTQKPTLLKPGAEKLAVLFQLDVQIANEQRHGPGDHLTVTSRATVFHAPTGSRVGYGEGMCSTRERKYAYREQKRVCPSCEKPTIFKSKPPQTGWYCWAKKGGCGANYAGGSAEARAIETQEIGDVENPDLPDLWNTVVKMAAKRARVDAILAVTGASALFTQDAEDIRHEAEQDPEASHAAAKPAPAEPGRPTTDESILGALKAAAAGLKGTQLRRAFKDVNLAFPTGPAARIFDHLAPASADALLVALQALRAPASQSEADLPWTDPDGLVSAEENEAAAARIAAEPPAKPAAAPRPPAMADDAQVARLRVAHQGLRGKQAEAILKARGIPVKLGDGLYGHVPADQVDAIIAEFEAAKPKAPAKAKTDDRPVTPPDAVKVLNALARGKPTAEVKGAFALNSIDYPGDEERFLHLTEDQVDDLMGALS